MMKMDGPINIIFIEIQKFKKKTETSKSTFNLKNKPSMISIMITKSNKTHHPVKDKTFSQTR